MPAKRHEKFVSGRVILTHPFLKGQGIIVVSGVPSFRSETIHKFFINPYKSKT